MIPFRDFGGVRQGDPALRSLTFLRWFFEVFRGGGFADPVGAVQPPTQVHQLAPLATEGTKRGVVPAGYGEGLLTGRTFESRHV